MSSDNILDLPPVRCRGCDSRDILLRSLSSGLDRMMRVNEQLETMLAMEQCDIEDVQDRVPLFGRDHTEN